MTDPIALAVWKEIAGLNMSVSHDRWHLDRVLEFAYALVTIYGGEREIITAAVLLHDLGRGDEARPHGIESIDASTEQALRILQALSYPADKTKLVLTAIAEHDQPHVRPSTLEGRILKDADFLAGFGAWGILRIAMWSGETNRSVRLVLNRLEHGMQRRLESLEFEASSQWARQEMLFSRSFLDRLLDPVLGLTQPTKGLYIVLEGISGSGKDTQASLVADRLRNRGHTIAAVSEPHEDWRVYRDAWRSGNNRSDPPSAVKKWLMVAARESLMEQTVRPALQEGKTVLSVRSFLSTLVYQCEDSRAASQVAFAHSGMPQPDLVLLLDIPDRNALDRIGAREKESGVYETQEQLEIHRQRYLNLGEFYFGSRLRIVDASGSKDQVAAAIWIEVEALLNSPSREFRIPPT